MNYNMILDCNNYPIGVAENKPYPRDLTDKFTDNKGFEIELNNVFLDEIHLKWGKYTSSNTKPYSVVPTQDTVVAHFCLLGSCVTDGNHNLNIDRGQCMLFKEEKDEYSYQMGVTNNQGSFFEVSLSPSLYADLFIGENQILDGIMNNQKLFAYLYQDIRFYSIISEMHNNKMNYSGKFKKLYLESKVIELLLLQISYLQNKNYKKSFKLQNKDIEAIHEVKNILNLSLEHISIPKLALRVGINQTKLKFGFKELFGKTIFDYLLTIRMEKAKKLLQDTNLPIIEIAELVGYKHSQHFSTAFRRKYGCLPKELRKM